MGCCGGFLSFLASKYNQMLDSQSPMLGGCSLHFASQFISSFSEVTLFITKENRRALYKYFQGNASNIPHVVMPEKIKQNRNDTETDLWGFIGKQLSFHLWIHSLSLALENSPELWAKGTYSAIIYPRPEELHHEPEIKRLLCPFWSRIKTADLLYFNAQIKNRSGNLLPQQTLSSKRTHYLWYKVWWVSLLSISKMERWNGSFQR